MGRRALLHAAALLATIALAACDTVRGVGRTARVPAGFDPAVAQAAVMAHPAYVATDGYRWDGESFFLWLREGGANAAVACWSASLDDVDEVEVASLWIDQVPDATTLTRSIELQRELVERLRACSPGLPAFESWTARWNGLEPAPAGQPHEYAR